MIHVLLCILKIILWIVLGVLGLLLLVLLALLFAPVTYRIEAEYMPEEDKKGAVWLRAKIKFLFLSILVKYDHGTRDLEQTLRVFGIRLGGKNKKEDIKGEEAADEPIQLQDEPGPEQDPVQMRELPKVEQDPVQTHTTNQIEADEMREPLHEEYDLWDNETEGSFGSDLPPEEKKLSGRIRIFCKGLISRVKSIFNRLSDFAPSKIVERLDDRLNELQKKKHTIQKKAERIKKFWTLDCTVKTRNYLKKYILSILRHISPRKVKGHIHYGFDEPYKTGQVTGYLSLMPFVYQKGLYLEPDFYNKVLEGNIDMRGHIQLGYILRIVLNINVWRTIRVVRRLVNR
ncbi:MAG: DUF2953 domain-containing protein [Wujia sp.]